MNYVLRSVLVMCVCSMLCACNQTGFHKVETKQEDTNHIQEQLNLIADQLGQCLAPADYANDANYYAVTDLDQNGRLELIVANVGGTGMYTYSTFYEVNESLDGVTVCLDHFQEGDSQADLISDEVPAYLDKTTGTIYYIFEDLLKNGAAEYYENKRALTLSNGEVQQHYLAYKSAIYTRCNT